MATNTPQQTRSEETRAKILDAALTLFSQNGYEPTGVAEICEKSGVSKGAFYHHFPTKQAIFIDLQEKWLTDLESEMTRAAAQAKSIPEALHTMAQRMQGVLHAADGRINFFLEFWIQARRDPEIWQRTIKPFRQYRKVFEHMITHGIKEGSFKEQDAELSSLALVSMAVGILLQGVVDPEGEKWDENTTKAVDFFIDAMLRR